MIGMIRDFILSKGYDFEIDLINGKWQKTTDKNGHKVWYVGTEHSNELTTFSFGDFREPDQRFFFTTKAALTEADEAQLKKFTKKVEEDKSLRQEIAKEMVSTLWSTWSKDDEGFGEIGKIGTNADYLIRKKLPRPPGVIVRPATESHQQILVVPMYDADGQLWNLQQIYAGGDKAFHPGAKGKDVFFTFKGEGEKIFIGEGFATCLAAHLATRATVICAFNISNLESAIRAVIAMEVPTQDIVLLSDWDGETFKRTGKNPGMIATQKLTEKYKCGFVSPCDPKEAPTHNEDFADLYMRGPEGPGVVELIIEEVKYFVDIEDCVFSVKKSEDSPSITHEVVGPCQLVSVEELRKNYDEAKLAPRGWASEPILVPFDTSSFEVQKLDVKRVGASWSPIKHQISTRNAGFHEVIPATRGSGVRYEPVYTDLRLAFEEKNPFVTHRDSEVVYGFNGKVFEMVPEIEMANFAEMNFDPKPKNNNVREFIGSVTRYNLKGDDFFSTEKKVNFLNGWLDLETLEFRPHGPEVGFKHMLNYEFDETASCPEFDAFLNRVLSGDQVLVQMVLEYLGYILSGDDCWAQVALVLKGEGSNGKSTFLKVVRALIGKQNLTSAKVSEFKSEYSRQLLDGKLANISEETPRDALLDSSIFKDIVAGGTIQVRAIYGSPYSMDVRAKMIFSCNDMPPTGDTSPALLRRLLIVPFNAVFTRETADPFIDRKIIKELPGIFNKSVVAYRSLISRGRFMVSEAVKEQVNEYQKSTNPVHSWLEDHVALHEVNSKLGQVNSSVSALFSNFKTYCENHGFKLMNVVSFGKALRRIVPDYEQRHGNTGKKTDRFRAIRGITTRDGQAIIENGRTGLEF